MSVLYSSIVYSIMYKDNVYAFLFLELRFFLVLRSIASIIKVNVIYAQIPKSLGSIVSEMF